MSESFELIFTVHDTQFHGVPAVKNLCSCIPDILMYENYFYKISSGTENSIYMKLYLYLHQHVFKGKLKSLKLAV